MTRIFERLLENINARLIGHDALAKGPSSGSLTSALFWQQELNKQLIKRIEELEREAGINQPLGMMESELRKVWNKNET